MRAGKGESNSPSQFPEARLSGGMGKEKSEKAVSFGKDQMLFLANLYRDFYDMLGSTDTTQKGNDLRNDKYQEVANLYNANPEWP